MNIIFSEHFVEKLATLGPDAKKLVKAAVDEVIKAPLKKNSKNYYPWPGCFEKGAGGYRIIYGVCGECRKQGFGSQHTECSTYADDTIFFRTFYVVF